MAVVSKSKSGQAAATVKPPELRRLPRTTRRPRSAGGTYEEARIDEISKRCELYNLRVARLRAGLLDRKEVETAYAAMTNAIKRVIAQSKLSKTEKEDIYGNLVTAAEFVANVAQAQRAGSKKGDEGPVVTGNGIDGEIGDI